LIKLCKKYSIRLNKKKFKNKKSLHLQWTDKEEDIKKLNFTEMNDYDRNILNIFKYYDRDYPSLQELTKSPPRADTNNSNKMASNYKNIFSFNKILKKEIKSQKNTFSSEITIKLNEGLSENKEDIRYTLNPTEDKAPLSPHLFNLKIIQFLNSLNQLYSLNFQFIRFLQDKNFNLYENMMDFSSILTSINKIGNTPQYGEFVKFKNAMSFDINYSFLNENDFLQIMMNPLFMMQTSN
jgi:hypothetical protein